MKPNRLDRQIRDDPEAFADLGIQIDERFVWDSGEFRSGVGGVVGGRKALFTVNKGTFFRSPTLLSKKWGSLDPVIRG